MKSFFSIFFHFIASVLLAVLAAGYWYVTTGISLERTSEIFLAVFLAASPLPRIAARYLIAWRIKRMLRGCVSTCSRMSALTDLMRVDTIAFNRNGTLTEGNIFISGLFPEGMTQSSLLSMAAGAEREATHPYAHAIYTTAMERGLRLQPSSMTHETASFGVEALIAQTPVRVGKREWMNKGKIDISAALLTRADQLATSGQTPLFVSSSKYARGIIAVRDDICPNARRALHQLRERGLSLILLTGETKRLANATGKELRIEEVRSDLTGTDKAREIRLLQSRGAIVAMVGDPATDQVAMSTADISIGCPSSLKKDPQTAPEEAPSDPLRAELLRGPYVENEDAAAPPPAPSLIAPEDAAYFEEQTRKNQGHPTNFTPDIELDKTGILSLVTLWDSSNAARACAVQNGWLTALFILLLAPAAAGAYTYFGLEPLSYIFVAAALGIFFVLLLLNTLRA